MKPLIALFVAVCVALTGCGWIGIRGNGHIVTDQRTVEDYSGIYSRGAFDIEWRTGEPGAAAARGDRRMVELGERQVGDEEVALPPVARQEHHDPIRLAKLVRAKDERLGAVDRQLFILTGVG